MDDIRELQKKIILRITICSLIIIVFWVVINPPGFDKNQKSDMYTLSHIFANIDSQSVVFSVIGTDIVDFFQEEIPIEQLIVEISLLELEDLFYLYSTQNKQLLVHVSETMLVLEQNGLFYYSEDGNDWTRFEQLISTTNPFSHIKHLNNYKLEQIYVNDSFYYSVVIEDAEVNFTYVIEMDNNNLYPLTLTIIKALNKSTELDIIKYHFYDWNQSYIIEKIDNILDVFSGSEYN
ncbi:hypothetical protein [Desulfuribacillus alkaliarsenatis]|uniref:Uncharacterized protein n=1 Tax=Desulfuribacillus alkaliarsenatis TaxID=766136 RepID=A0A1E5G0K4_9FIRM|nr:hypothetical protein [Desulfuribacillus alkaliarsenatis]OEF95988.1 hypothetical protein BHF68_09565 [Desulfuribacillus alkaliarsenatis]